MSNNQFKVPIWFWIVAGIALLWNLMGLFAFYADMTMSESALAELTEAQRNLYQTEPLWAKIAFGGAVILGVLGSIALLLRKNLAIILLSISVLFVIVQMIHGFMSDAYSIMGNGAMMMGFVVLIFATFLIWFAKFSSSQGILN